MQRQFSRIKFVIELAEIIIQTRDRLTKSPKIRINYNNSKAESQQVKTELKNKFP